MPWTGYPETTVTQLTYTEWTFSLGAQHEVQIGYSIRVADAWELFGNGHWLWFTGAVVSSRGAVQIMQQWAEVQPLGAQQRVWQWVHWRNPSEVEVVVRPYLLLAPPIEPGWLVQSEQTTVHKRIWTLVDVVAATSVRAFGHALAGAGGTDGTGAGSGTGGPGLETAVAVRPLAHQRLQEIELEGDLRYLPMDELWGRIDQLLEDGQPLVNSAANNRLQGEKR